MRYMKMFSYVFLVLLLIGNVNAFEFDNVKSYDLETKTISVINAFGLGDTIAKVQLKTPLNVIVPRGYQKVAEFEVTSFQDYTEAFKELELFDKNKGDQKFIRDYDYKVRSYETIDVNDYTNNCLDVWDAKNGTFSEECSQVLSGTHEEQREVWTTLNSSDFKTNDIITIGIFTDVKKGDLVEWVLNLFGVRVEEWSVWTESLNVGLVSYYSLDENIGTFTEDLVFGNYNGTLINSPSWVIGKLSNAVNFTYNGTNKYIDVGTSSDISSSSLTWGVWVYREGNGQYGSPYMNIMSKWKSSNLGFSLGIYTGGEISVYTQVGGWSNFNGIIEENQWYHIVVTAVEGGDTKIYINGELNDSTSGLSWTDKTGRFLIGFNDNDAPFNGTLDEVFVYNRTLSASEISDIYNNGIGLIYTLKGVETSLISPDNLIETINFSLIFDSSAVCGVCNLTNATLNVWNSNSSLFGTNFTSNTGGISNSTNLSISGLTILDGYLWNVEWCGSNNNCSFAITNRTFDIKSIRINSQTFNTTSFQTAQESFIINVSSTGLETVTANLIYNGTSYTGTKTGDNSEMIFTKTLQVPLIIGDASFYWNVSYGGTITTSATNNQSISQTIVGICNSSLTSPFINYTFKDEGNSSSIIASIPTSTFYYWLGDGSINKSLTYINNTENSEYSFCAEPIGRTFNWNQYIQYKSSGYPQRTYNPAEIQITNVTTNQTLYLLATVDGIYVTFQVINSAAASQALSGVVVNATRVIDGSTEIVENGITGSDGLVTFWLNPDFLHTFSFSKIGYDIFTTSITPTQSSYTIALGEVGETNTTNYYQGITVRITPTEDFLTNNTLNNFTLHIISLYWDITEFGFTLYNGDGTSINATNSTLNGGLVSINDTNVSSDSIYMRYYYIVNSTTIYSGSARTWILDTATGTSFSILYFFTDLVLYLDAGMFGADDFFRVTIIFLFIIMFVGGISYEFGIRSNSAIMGMLFGLVLFFDVGLGSLNILPTLSIGDIQLTDHFLTFITGIILIGVVVQEARR